MAQLGFNWPIATMKGKACGHDDTYVNTDRITGKSYAVKLCNPVTEFNADQKAAQTRFGNLSKAVSLWIANGKDEETAEYTKLAAAVKAQHTYPTVKSYIMGKRMYSVATDGKVTITVYGKSTTYDPSTWATTSGSSSDGNV